MVVMYPEKSRDDIVTLAWKRYLRELQQRPIRTKAFTAAASFALSDVIAQKINGGPFNVKRNLAALVWGLVWGGPSAHYWQNFMERVTRGRKDMATLLLKVFVDQMTFGPLNNLMTMAFLTFIVEDKGLDHFQHKVVHDYPGIQLNGWKLWPAAAMFNYRYVPLQLRVLFLNAVALGWSTFLNISSTKIKGS